MMGLSIHSTYFKTDYPIGGKKFCNEFIFKDRDKIDSWDYGMGYGGGVPLTLQAEEIVCVPRNCE